MYLTRLILNPRSRAVWRDLSDCHAMHRTVMSGFPDLEDDSARDKLGVLWRLESQNRAGLPELLVQSEVLPHWSKLPDDYLHRVPDNPSCKDVGAAYSALESGRLLRFRLLANPTRKIDTRTGPDGKRRNGRRVELTSEEDRLAWLQRKAASGGFELVQVAMGSALDVQVSPAMRLGGWRRHEAEKRRLTFGAVSYEGVLKVVDAALFRQTIENGIGTAKAFGFGLLSVAPAGATLVAAEP